MTDRKCNNYKLALFVCLIQVFAASLVPLLGGGKPDEKILIVKGIAYSPDNPAYSDNQKRLMARRGAILDAYRKALILMNRPEAKKAEGNPYRTIHIRGLIKGAKILDVIYLEGGGAKVTISIPNKNNRYKSRN